MKLTRIFKPYSSKEKSLVLHIGMPKTGTTAIQGFLAHNRKNLIQQKIFYPECGVPINQHTALVKSIASPLFDWVHFNDAIDQIDANQYVLDILRTCKTNGCNKVIVSSEYFWASPAMQSGPSHHTPSVENFNYIGRFIGSCHKLFSAFDKVKVIVYLRRQDEWFDSFFNQQLKDGFPIPSTDELLNGVKNYLLYHANLTIWAEYFGKENLVVRNYDYLPDRDVVKDFVKIARLRSQSLSQPMKTQDFVNAKLSRKSAALMRQAIHMKLDAELQALLRQVLQGLSPDPSNSNHKREYTLFDPDFYSSVLALYNEDNKKLSDDYINLDLTNSSKMSAISQDEEKNFISRKDETEDLIMALLKEIEKTSQR
ncbi:MAG: hypothetical protein KJO28_13045 [Desulfofustis sp.]|nr:hypothetical protein [Desulfofustis sp.]